MLGQVLFELVTHQPLFLGTSAQVVWDVFVNRNDTAMTHHFLKPLSQVKLDNHARRVAQVTWRILSAVDPSRRPDIDTVSRLLSQTAREATDFLPDPE
mmetsp:Transcript_22301/g.52846  ORF Transcript_22301/g.52846 Transcript_22301/m.52846 type:complete len:98 (+) Transcript_22301:148-441(+)